MMLIYSSICAQNLKNINFSEELEINEKFVPVFGPRSVTIPAYIRMSSTQGKSE